MNPAHSWWRRVLGLTLVAAGVLLVADNVRALLRGLVFPLVGDPDGPTQVFVDNLPPFGWLCELVLAGALGLVAVRFASGWLARTGFALVAIGLAIYGLAGLIVIADPDTAFIVIQALSVGGGVIACIFTLTRAPLSSPASRLFAASMFLLVVLGLIYFSGMIFGAVSGFGFYTLEPAGETVDTLLMPDLVRGWVISGLEIGIGVLLFLAGGAALNSKAGESRLAPEVTV